MRIRLLHLLAFACSTLLLAPAQGQLERSIQAPGPLGALRGSLLQAARPDAPLALIIPGSGPTDRDGNSPAGLKASTYRLLAQGLVARGITVARVDKRGMFSSAQAIADANQVSLQDYAADVHTWARELRQDMGARCAWVIGHSEGGLVALLAGDTDPGICGAILIAAPGRPLGKVLREQLKANPANAPLLDQAFAAIVSLEGGRHVDIAALPPPLVPLFHPRVQDFLISALAVDPAQAIAAYRKPVLILQGERDLQVTAQDAKALARAAPNAQLALIPDANHVLKRVTSDDRAANFATYSDPTLPLADGFVEAIAQFVAKHGTR